MTFQNTSEQFIARGKVTPTTVFQSVLNFFAPVGQMFAAIGTGLIKAGEASSRMEAIQTLNAKSDAELAELGVKRDDIVRYVFKDLFYI